LKQNYFLDLVASLKMVFVVPEVAPLPLASPQGSDAWHGDVSAALVSWQ